MELCQGQTSWASSSWIVECSHCPGGLGLLADGAESEQAHHCAGWRGSSLPSPERARESLGPEPCLVPWGLKGSQEESFCWLVDSRSRDPGSWKRPVFLKPRLIGNVGRRWEALGSGHFFSSCLFLISNCFFVENWSTFFVRHNFFFLMLVIFSQARIHLQSPTFLFPGWLRKSDLIWFFREPQILLLVEERLVCGHVPNPAHSLGWWIKF